VGGWDKDEYVLMKYSLESHKLNRTYVPYIFNNNNKNSLEVCEIDFQIKLLGLTTYTTDVAGGFFFEINFGLPGYIAEDR
jgi:hypothetical protein